jgi:hypothetical protein
MCSRKLKALEKKYKEFSVQLQLRTSEFCAPQHLKDEIESDIKQLLTGSSTTTFKSIELSKDIIEIAEKHLKYIARRNHCYIRTELRHKSQQYTIPKALSSSIHASKSTIKQSDQFLSSSDVFNKIAVANGLIEIRTGDIALQKVSFKRLLSEKILSDINFSQVDTIVISTTFNGLKEGVIVRAGGFEHEQSFTDTTGTEFIETMGGNLHCKRILFSSWIPPTTTNDENDLRKSIESFVSKSIEYAANDRHLKSIAFAVPDSCTNEEILAQGMIGSAKQQLESKKLQLKISFILLPEQETLHRQFFTLIGAMQNIYAYFDWPNAGRIHIL